MKVQETLMSTTGKDNREQINKRKAGRIKWESSVTLIIRSGEVSYELCKVTLECTQSLLSSYNLYNYNKLFMLFFTFDN